MMMMMMVGWLVGLGLFSITVPGIETGHYGDDAASWLATASQRRPGQLMPTDVLHVVVLHNGTFLVTYHWSCLGHRCRLSTIAAV